ncbi:MAG: hypothetical protein Q9176_008031 [Flavoplaca citrina]
MVAPVAVAGFQELTGLGRNVVEKLFKQHYQSEEVPDYHHAIVKARAAGVLAWEKANVASMVHLTGVKQDRAIQLLEQISNKYDLNLAILEGRNVGDYGQTTTSTAQFRALTTLPLREAQFYLEAARPQGYVEAAIGKAATAGAITPAVTDLAILKLLTNFPDAVATKLLASSTDIADAIMKGQDFFKYRSEFPLARLRFRFRMHVEDARRVLNCREINGDYEKAFRYVLVSQVMDQVIVDRKDAYEYLNQFNGNVEKAVQLAKDKQLLQPTVVRTSADTRNPPNVTVNTHIIGVLGVNDLGPQRRASPGLDGWMVSDYYLFMSILQGMGKSQSWLNCENPYSLLQKYGSEAATSEYTNDEGKSQTGRVSWSEGYLHGDPFEERVLVLGPNNFDGLAKRLTLTNAGTDLRDKFLRRVEEVCRVAEAANEPVLLMGFCHGDDSDMEKGGLCIGIDPGSQNDEDFLTPALLARVLAKTPNVRVSMYLTSCFSGMYFHLQDFMTLILTTSLSGNWVITPQLKAASATVMAAAQPEQESFAWELSSSMRHAGGVYTSAFLKELQQEPNDLPEDADADESRTYQQVCQAVVAEASRLWVQMGGSTPMFTPEGGHDKFWRRTGFTLADYKRNYDRLQKFPASDPNPIRDKKRDINSVSAAEIAAWEARHPEEADETYSSRTGGYGRTRRGMKTSLTYLASRYMSSYPGPRNAPSNTGLQYHIELFKAGQIDNDINLIEQTRSQVLYRTWMMQLANRYRRILNLNKIPIIQAWNQEQPTPASLSLANSNLTIIREANLFRRPHAKGHWGQRWQKPALYLAHAFAASEYGPEDVHKHLAKLAQMEASFTAYKTQEYNKLPTAQGSLRQMSAILKRSWSKSQQKPKRTSLEEAGMLDWETLAAQSPSKQAKLSWDRG